MSGTSKPPLTGDTGRMPSRAWWTVIITALTGPLGSIGLGIGLALLADATTGGMASLAGGVVGLWLGAPLAALIAFAICLVTVARPLPLRRWIALLVMLAAVVIESIVVLVGLSVTARLATPDVGLVLVAIAAVGLLGGGAYAALRMSLRPGGTAKPPLSGCAVQPAAAD